MLTSKQRLALSGFEAERVRVGSLVAVTQTVVRIGQQRIGPSGDDDVNVYQFGSERLLDGDLLHVCQQDDFVDALGDECVHGLLDDRGQRVNVGPRPLARR